MRYDVNGMFATFKPFNIFIFRKLYEERFSWIGSGSKMYARGNLYYYYMKNITIFVRFRYNS